MAKKHSNKTIATGALLETRSLAHYLRLKLDQLGVAQQEAAAAMGYQSGYVMLSRVINEHEEAKAFPDERIERLKQFFADKHQELKMDPYDATEGEHLNGLNYRLLLSVRAEGQKHMAKIRPLQADSTITEEALLATTSFAEYLECKRKQLGISQTAMDETLGYRRVYENLISGKRTGQFAPQTIELLIGKIKSVSLTIKGVGALSAAEENHLRTLHSQLEPYVLKQKEVKAPTLPQKNYTPDSILQGYNKYYSPMQHVAPTAALLEALDTGQHETWARLKAELLKGQGNKRVYLRGFPARLCNLKNFNLSQCDLIDFQWPSLPQKAQNIASLKDAALIDPAIPSRQGRSAYFMLHWDIRRAYERDNPQALNGQPLPMPTLFGRTVSQRTLGDHLNSKEAKR